MAKVTRLTLDNNGGLERRRLHLREISDDMDTPLDTVDRICVKPVSSRVRIWPRFPAS
jgi:hypothetical protein